MENTEQIHNPQVLIPTPSVHGSLSNPGSTIAGLQGLVDSVQTYVQENPIISMVLGAGLLLMASEVMTGRQAQQKQQNQTKNSKG